MLPRMITDQNRVFVNGEADRYFERNAAHNAAYDIETDIVANMIHGLPVRAFPSPKSIADLGCSSGERLSAMCARYGVTGLNGLGVDASSAAIDVAEKRDPDLYWRRADWAYPSFLDSGYDLVITSFAWHWMERRSLLDAMTSVHHHVNDGGLLVVNDFVSYADVPYRHRDGLMTFKRDHAAMFVATRLYEVVAEERYDYPGTEPGEDPCACVAMRRIQ